MQYYQMGLNSILAEFKRVLWQRLSFISFRQKELLKVINLFISMPAEILYEQGDYGGGHQNYLEWVTFFKPDMKIGYQYLIQCYYQLGNKKGSL